MEAIIFTTKERATKGNIKLEPRDVYDGGIVQSIGQREQYPTLLDKLTGDGFLGQDEKIANQRRDVGIRLRSYWQEFNNHKASSGESRSGFNTFVSEGEIGDTNDAAWTIFNATMKNLDPKYRVVVRAVCIDDKIPELQVWGQDAKSWHVYALLRSGLDDLENAMKAAESEFRELE